jgi:hypothetical protein
MPTVKVSCMQLSVVKALTENRTYIASLVICIYSSTHDSMSDLSSLIRQNWGFPNMSLKGGYLVTSSAIPRSDEWTKHIRYIQLNCSTICVSHWEASELSHGSLNWNIRFQS